jgi:RNA polymerase sigma factor (sigma-70 family)
MEDDIVGEPDTGLVGLLTLLADRGEGTVLGLPPRGRMGITRVSRTQADQFAHRLAEAYRERFPTLVRFATRKVGDHTRAEDVVQRAFEKVLRRHAGDAPEITNLDAYVLTAVCNEINRELRSYIGQRERDAGTDSADSPALGDVSARVTEALVLRRELDRLAPRERQAVVIRMQWQLSVAETAEVMGLSAGAVKRYTADGLHRLRERMAATA